MPKNRKKTAFYKFLDPAELADSNSCVKKNPPPPSNLGILGRLCRMIPVLYP